MSLAQKHYVNLWGGLGNQLYILAYADYLKSFNLDVSLKIGGQAVGNTTDRSLRNLMLDIPTLLGFNVESEISEPYFIWQESFEQYPCFIPSVQGNSERNLYYGYFQSYKYASDKFKQALYAAIQQLSPVQYNVQPNDVALHIRRGDFLTNGNENVQCKIELPYYLDGLEYISKKEKINKVYIFSDSFDEIQTEISAISAKYEVELVLNQSVLEDMSLLTQFRHYVIGNSTFSWWGAFLSKYSKSEQNVVVPAKPWLFDNPNASPFPPEWVKLAAFQETVSVQPVILCGGSGSRLWPLSRSGYPKQFLTLGNEQTLFQQAVERVQHFANKSVEHLQPLIVTHEEHRFLVAEQLRTIGQKGDILLEPAGRNTAPALTFAALQAVAEGQDPILVITPSDHLVKDKTAFSNVISQALPQANWGHIVILGINPTHPDTAYGYIQTAQSDSDVKSVIQFVEKPDLATAESYVQTGNYYWNAGLFIMKASVWLKAIRQFRADIFEAVDAAFQAKNVETLDGMKFIRPDTELFKQVPSESIDYAVMEHCVGSEFNLKMLPLNAGWSDLGSWDSVWQSLPKNAQGNAIIGDAVAINAQNNLIYATNKLVSVVGVENLIVVETADAVLVTDHAHSQEIKQLVSHLEQQKRPETQLHRKVYRPWGWYDSVDEEGRFKVKRIGVNVGASLSLQKHHHRAEHWVVVKGTAEVTCGDKIHLLGENQSIYIPLGEIHRLYNPGKIPLEIIEVQTGSYLGEDDIIRLQDYFGRG